MPDGSDETRVLVLEDETSMQKVFSEILTPAGYKTKLVSSIAEARTALQQESFHLLILDRKLPDGDGVELLRRLRAESCTVPALIITGFPSVQSAIEALGEYAADYLCKPFEPEELLAKIKRIMQSSAEILDNAYLWESLRSRFNFHNVLSRSPIVEGCYVAGAKVADSSVSVLIEGETGTGKEYLARTIHYMSKRSNRAFVPVNCGAIPEALLESELFGHEKGAFTSATSKKPGLCEMADGGTLFLDEISEMSMEMQVKLLRFLQDSQLMHLGGTQSIEVDVRTIAATNADLRRAVKEGTFREDLFYRLNVVPLHLPPLRERLEDIILFANHFIKRHGAEGPAASYTLSMEAVLQLQRYDWPGNLRELENVIRCALLIADGGVIEPTHLMIGANGTMPNYLPALRSHVHEKALLDEGQKAVAHLPETPEALVDLQDVEKAHIIKVLGVVSNNKTRAAEILGIARKTLRAKMDRYEIPEEVAAAPTG
jgi:two-component system, NtrC family, response regulator AtoC